MYDKTLPTSEFEQKAAAIIALYLNPPRNAAVFCVDEESTIQALDRRDRRLPLSPGRAEKHGFEYYRHGTKRPDFQRRSMIRLRSDGEFFPLRNPAKTG